MQDDKQTKLQFAAVLNAVFVGMYHKPELQRETLAMWFMSLAKFSVDEVRSALSAHVGDAERGQFPPRPADVVRQIEGTASGAAPLAWGKVMRAAAQVGAYATVAFDEPAIHAAISDIGGWQAMCHTGTDELPFLQRRFEASYRSYRERKNFDYPSRLTGIHAQNNAALGYGTSDGAVLIGDPDQCRLVLERGSSGGLRITHDGPKDSGSLKAIGGAALSLISGGKAA